MKTLLTLALVMLTTTQAFGHGEDKLGPNGGYIRMPGGFHTEVVPNSDGTFSVYLLDISFKKPTIKKSKVTATLDNGTKTEIKCSPMRNHFHCYTKPNDLKNGSLIILAERNEAKGAEAVYTLPLALPKGAEGKKEEDHSAHH